MEKKTKTTITRLGCTIFVQNLKVSYFSCLIRLIIPIGGTLILERICT